MEIEKWVQEGNDLITKKHTCTVDERRFWFVTSDENEYRDLVLDPAVANDEIVFVDRNNILDANGRVEGTLKIFHVRSENNILEGSDTYPLHSSTMPCACDDCLSGLFRECKYLSEHGNVKTHKLRKKTG